MRRHVTYNDSKRIVNKFRKPGTDLKAGGCWFMYITRKAQGLIVAEQHCVAQLKIQAN